LTFKENRELWLQRVEDFHASGLTQAQWCQTQGVGVTALRYWLRKLKEESTDEAPEWVQLNVTDKAVNSPTDASIKVHVGSFRIDICQGFEQSLLLDVIKTLMVLC